MAYIKSTVLILKDGTVTRRSGHWTNPDILGKVGAVGAGYYVLDTSGLGRGGSSHVTLDGQSSDELKIIANKA